MRGWYIVMSICICVCMSERKWNAMKVYARGSIFLIVWLLVLCCWKELSSMTFHVLATRRSELKVSKNLVIAEVYLWWILSLLFFFILVVSPPKWASSFFLSSTEPSSNEPFFVNFTLIDVNLTAVHILRIDSLWFFP